MYKRRFCAFSFAVDNSNSVSSCGDGIPPFSFFFFSERREVLKGQIYSDVKGKKLLRLPHVPENDDAALINLIIDPLEGILKYGGKISRLLRAFSVVS